MQIRIDLFVHGLSTHEDDKLDLILRNQVKTLASMKDLNDEIAGLKQDIATLSTAVDAFIVSDKDNFQKLLDAIAANDPAAIQLAVDDIKAARATLAQKKADVESADASDNLPTP